MWVLIGVLMLGVPTEPLSLANLQGKWTVGLMMDGFLHFKQYSISWRPWKTVTLGIDGSCSFYKQAERYKSWSGSLGIRFYKYFRPNSPFSPFISLSPGFMMSYSYYVYYEEERQEYRVSLDPGAEYFFSLFNKQLSMRFQTNLANISRTYPKYMNSDGKSDSNVYDRVSFEIPTAGSLSTWLCFHF